MLKSFVKGIADAIRSKEGSSELISPMDFAQRIEALQVGEGGGTNDSSIEYLDVREIEYKGQVVMFSQLIKLNNVIVPSAALLEMALNEPDGFFAGLNEIIKQVAIIPSLEVNLGEPQTIGNIIDDYANIPRITKEQFYDLTT